MSAKRVVDFDVDVIIRRLASPVFTTYNFTDASRNWVWLPDDTPARITVYLPKGSHWTPFNGERRKEPEAKPLADHVAVLREFVEAHAIKPCPYRDEALAGAAWRARKLLTKEPRGAEEGPKR